MRFFLIAAMMLSSSFPLRAADLSGSLRTWFEHVKQGLAESSVAGQRQHGRLTAVAAVRGEKQDAADPAKPVWKSPAQTRKAKALRAQKAELGAAVDAILAGKLDEGKQKLDAFEKAHPSSSLLPEAKDMRAHLEQAQAVVETK